MALLGGQQGVMSALKKSAVFGGSGALLVYAVSNVEWGRHGPYFPKKPNPRELLVEGAILTAGLFGLLLVLDTVMKPAPVRSSIAHVSGNPLTDVFHAQWNLGKLGYAVEATGQLDARTTNALKSFQATYSLQRTDGSVNPETLAYLDTLVRQLAQQVDPQTGLHQSITSFT